jgi:hypothetical protein
MMFCLKAWISGRPNQSKPEVRRAAGLQGCNRSSVPIVKSPSGRPSSFPGSARQSRWSVPSGGRGDNNFARRPPHHLASLAAPRCPCRPPSPRGHLRNFAPPPYPVRSPDGPRLAVGRRCLPGCHYRTHTAQPAQAQPLRRTVRPKYGRKEGSNRRPGYPVKPIQRRAGTTPIRPGHHDSSLAAPLTCPTRAHPLSAGRPRRVPSFYSNTSPPSPLPIHTGPFPSPPRRAIPLLS